MKNRITILNCPIDNLTMNETINLIDNSIKERVSLQHVVVNAAKMVKRDIKTKKYGQMNDQ